MFDLFEKMAESNETTPTSTSSASGNVFVVSIGGSILVKDKINSTLIAKIAESINNLRREGYKFVVVVGGGKTARDYIAAARTLGTENNYLLDKIAINVTRLNASILIHSIDDSHPEVLTRIDDAKKILEEGKVPVYGGLVPGFTTDTVSALLSEFLEGTFVNLTNQEGIYTADPATTKRATLIEKMDHKRLLRIIQRIDSRNPGENVILDSITCMLLNRSSIRSIVLSVDDLANFENAVRGNEFKGTLIETLTTETEDDIESI